MLNSETALAAVTFGLLRLASRMPGWLKKILLVCGAALAGNAVREVIFLHTSLPANVFRGVDGKSLLVASSLLLTTGGVFAFRYFKVTTRLLESGLMVCLPAVA